MKIDTSSPVMITGATGYVAGPIVKELLTQGLTVHCPVRDPTNKDKLKYLQDVADASKGTIQFFKADLVDEGSYLESMKGCSVVIHTASPFVVDVVPNKVDEVLLTPAVKGTENVLNSVSKTSTVKRVVLTSSCYAALTDAADSLDAPNGVTNEDVWNTTASRTYNPYAYSKVLAEQKAWEMAEAQSQYKLVVINPAWVMGPGLKVHPTSESYSFMKLLGDGAMKGGCPKMGVMVVDVRDVAQAHLAAAFSDQAAGRYLISGYNTTLFDFASILTKEFPDWPLPKSSPPKFLVWLLAPFLNLTRHQVARGVNYVPNIDHSKSQKDLEMVYRPMEETFPEMFQQMIDDGIISLPKQ